MVLPIFALLSILALSVAGSPEVKLKGTTIKGVDLAESKVEFFGGIPFAETPVGKRRFRSPILKTRLDVPTFNATDFGKLCLQPVSPALCILCRMNRLSQNQPAELQSEDCLSINIHRPAGTKPGAKLPILLWRYGGGFIGGGALFYNGSLLVAQSVSRGTPIIHVNYGYRLGPFGYPQGEEAFRRRELNLGQKDTLTALEWVHANIHEFGGDKNKITIFGESAGAGGIGALYLVKGFEKLVRGAILESGASNLFSLYNATEREAPWQGFVKNVPSCAAIATSGNVFPCLQNATEEEIKTSYLEPSDPSYRNGGLMFTPTLDSGPGSFFPDFTSRLYKEGKFARIPFISGTNLDEGTFLSQDARSPNFTETDLRKSMLVNPVVSQSRLEAAVDHILKAYPDVPASGSPYRTGNELFGLKSIYKRACSIRGDMYFVAPWRHWMYTATNYNVKSYAYIFTQPQGFVSEPAVGVQHAAEMPYLFGDSTDPTPGGQHLSKLIMEYWISFAVNLDPNDNNGLKRPKWPQYTKGNKVILQLEGDNTKTIKDDFRKEQMDFLIENAIVFRR
ncbi:triacylglycerol lipase 3 [Coprinopsis sp. MPI-PUGE-AT-0042]|nr:triacylglycerol lipase 3 [Coprinopsis sp. MPI-PUGE-AT-0042]